MGRSAIFADLKKSEMIFYGNFIDIKARKNASNICPKVYQLHGWPGTGTRLEGRMRLTTIVRTNNPKVFMLIFANQFGAKVENFNAQILLAMPHKIRWKVLEKFKNTLRQCSSFR